MQDCVICPNLPSRKGSCPSTHEQLCNGIKVFTWSMKCMSFLDTPTVSQVCETDETRRLHIELHWRTNANNSKDQWTIDSKTLERVTPGTVQKCTERGRAQGIHKPDSLHASVVNFYIKISRFSSSGVVPIANGRSCWVKSAHFLFGDRYNMGNIP